MMGKRQSHSDLFSYSVNLDERVRSDHPHTMVLFTRKITSQFRYYSSVFCNELMKRSKSKRGYDENNEMFRRS